MTERRFEAGEIIFREGDPADYAYVIHAGRVEIAKETGTGPLTLALLGEGDMFGEMGVLDAATRSATARAVEPVVASAIDHAALLATFVCRPRDSLAVLRALIKRLRAMNRWIAEVAPVAGGGPARVSVEIAAVGANGNGADDANASAARAALALDIGPRGARLKSGGERITVNGQPIGGAAGCDAALLRPGVNEVVVEGWGGEALRLSITVDRAATGAEPAASAGAREAPRRS